MEGSCLKMNALENDKPTGLKFPQLMGMVYRTDFEVPDDIPKAVGIARWLDTQTEGLALDSPDDVEQDQSINSEVSSISEFSSLKTDFVKLLFDNSITNDSDIAALNTLDETIHEQQEQERQEEEQHEREEEHQQEYWQERYEKYGPHEQHEQQSSQQAPQQAPQQELREYPESQEHPEEHEHPEEQEHQQERRQELRDQQDPQEHQERASSDENDGNTLFDLDPIDEMNQIDEEVINMIFTEGVIREIRYTLQQIQA